MKKFTPVLLLFLTFYTATAQILKPVKWTSKLEKISQTEFNIILNGIIDPDWHLYSQYTPEGGPLSMLLTFKNQKSNYNLVGKATESSYKKKFNDVFEVDEYFFEKTVTITQKIKIINTANSKIFLHVEYQVCKDVCINDTKDFNFDLPISAKIKPTATKHLSNVNPNSQQQIHNQNQQTAPKQFSTNISTPISQKGLWSIFILAFLGGLTALVTPCVFPMIPMTVSFFLKQSKNKAQGVKNAFIYGFSIIAIYVVLGLAINAIFGADADPLNITPGRNFPNLATERGFGVEGNLHGVSAALSQAILQALTPPSAAQARANTSQVRCSAGA